MCQLVFIALALLEVLYDSVQRNGHWVSSIEGSRIRWMAPYDYVRCLRMADNTDGTHADLGKLLLSPRALSGRDSSSLPIGTLAPAECRGDRRENCLHDMRIVGDA